MKVIVVKILIVGQVTVYRKSRGVVILLAEVLVVKLIVVLQVVRAEVRFANLEVHHHRRRHHHYISFCWKDNNQ